jgi:hypothetical protein
MRIRTPGAVTRRIAPGARSEGTARWTCAAIGVLIAPLLIACGGTGSERTMSARTPTPDAAPIVRASPTGTTADSIPTSTLEPTTEPVPHSDTCGQGRTPEEAIDDCELGVEYFGDCQLAGRIDQFDGGPPSFSCSLWISSHNDVRLYQLAFIEPRFVMLEPDGGGGWLASRVDCGDGESGWLCRPEPFDDVEALLCGQFGSDFNGTVSFRVTAVRVFSSRGTIEVEMEFRGSGLTPVPWTTDVGRTDIYLTDNAGTVYASRGVGGHFALDLPPLDALERSGWHEFHVGDPYRVFRLTYGHRGPFTLDLATAPPCPEGFW